MNMAHNALVMGGMDPIRVNHLRLIHAITCRLVRDPASEEVALHVGARDPVVVFTTSYMNIEPYPLQRDVARLGGLGVK
jgi:hypothetical protein